MLEIFAKLAAELGTFDDPAYAQIGKRKANVFDFRLEESEEKQSVREVSASAAVWNGQGVRSAASR